MMEEPTTPARAKTRHSGPARISTVHEKIQVASGDLKAASQPADPLYTKSIESLEIAQIQPFTLIPDYKTPTASPYPIIVTTPNQGCFCIDGWELIEQTRHQNRQSIQCEIIFSQSDSQIEISLNKVAVRSMPPGGNCSYPEMVGNTVRLFKMLMESGEKLEVFSHGGARRGTNFKSCRDQDVITVLERRLGKKRKTLLKQLDHGEYLNEEALNTLIEDNEHKEFFEAIQQGKQNLVAELKAARRSQEAIVELVSQKMLFWHKEYWPPSAIEINQPKLPQTDHYTKEKASRSIRNLKTSKFTHWTGNEPAATEPPIDEEYVRSEIRRIGTELVSLSESPDLPKPEQVQAVQNFTIQLSRLTSYLIRLSDQSDAAKEAR